jgi:phosphoglycolate phosphatase-like HAD superfamily hydrolase
MDTTINDAIAIDLDGTLIDIAARDYAVYKAILHENSYKCLPFDTYWEQRRNRTDIFQVLAQTGLPSNFFQLFIARREQYIESKSFLQLDKLFPYTINAVEYLKEKYSCYLVTRRQNKENAQWQLSELGLDAVFGKSNIFIVRDSKKEIFNRIPRLTLVIGDTENDIIPAKELNKTSVAVCSGIRSEDCLSKLGPSYIIPDIRSAKEILSFDAHN